MLSWHYKPSQLFRWNNSRVQLGLGNFNPWNFIQMFSENPLMKFKKNYINKKLHFKHPIWWKTRSPTLWEIWKTLIHVHVPTIGPLFTFSSRKLLVWLVNGEVDCLGISSVQDWESESPWCQTEWKTNFGIKTGGQIKIWWFHIHKWW